MKSEQCKPRAHLELLAEILVVDDAIVFGGLVHRLFECELNVADAVALSVQLRECLRVLLHHTTQHILSKGQGLIE